MTTTADRFLDKLDTFADTLDDEERSILVHLLSDDTDETSGFAMRPAGPSGYIAGGIILPTESLRPRVDRFVAPGDGAFADITMGGTEI